MRGAALSPGTIDDLFGSWCPRRDCGRRLPWPGPDQQHYRRCEAEPRQPADRSPAEGTKTRIGRQSSQVIGQEGTAPYALPLAQPCRRQARHVVRRLAEHEAAAHRHAVYCAPGRAGDEQAERQATRPRGTATQRHQDVATEDHSPTQACTPARHIDLNQWSANLAETAEIFRGCESTIRMVVKRPRQRTFRWHASNPWRPHLGADRGSRPRIAQLHGKLVRPLVVAICRFGWPDR